MAVFLVSRLVLLPAASIEVYAIPPEIDGLSSTLRLSSSTIIEETREKR
jgi:hypothetical protein